MSNITMIRINSKLDELFRGKIDMSDCTENNEQSAFYSRSLAALSIMMQCGIDVETASKSITDAYHDMGIDAVYCDARQKKLILAQSKWHISGTGGISQEEILSFIQGVKRIMSLDFEGANPKIMRKVPEITSAIRNMDYQILCVFTHTGNQQISTFCSKPIDELLQNTNDDANDILNFVEVLQSDIFKYLATGQDSDNICIDDVILNNWGFIDEPFKAYYGTLSAAALGEWYSNYDNKLFAKNIRYYKGDTEVNQGIRKVLLESPENFFYYNNGIKILCKKITRKAAFSTNAKTGLFALEGVSLVNGAQTTGTIGTTFLENPDQVSKATVFVQLIDLANVDETCSLQITKLSNTQNKIDSKEFAALDPEQERLKTDLIFSNIYYLYKSGAKIDDPLHQVSIDEAIVAQACLQDDITYSTICKKGVGSLTEDITKTPYKILFNSSTNAFAMKNSIEVLRAVDKYLQIHENDYQARNRLALIHGNRFILYVVLQSIKCHPKYTTEMIGVDEISNFVDNQCGKVIPKIVDAMNVKFPDAYPAYIFKNIGRCRLLFAEINNCN